ncbi:Germin-like protein subfamily 1 member 17 [Morella rubra]|uniref:Germin-like protein n=1 Tax=Morella rubra TaxID=262757 RepID=A0A6A1V367_9ROSI|nr:Germin-like protein subfamily 1 member 17 [Morella rubra]
MYLVTVLLFALACSLASAFDPSPLQDFCVATKDSDDNRLFTKVLNKGDVFVFLIGLIHFQWSMGNTDALIFAGLSSQNPGVITIANAVFGSNPPINPDVLTKAFQVDKNVINYLEQQFK